MRVMPSGGTCTSAAVRNLPHESYLADNGSPGAAYGRMRRHVSSSEIYDLRCTREQMCFKSVDWSHHKSCRRI